MSNKNVKIKVSHKGNQKLGKNISTFSRPVGDTCDNGCSFLNNGCYAQKVEKIYTNTRLAYLHNMRVQDWQKLRGFFLVAHSKSNSVRLHVNGDFKKTDRLGRKILDVKYLNNIIKALKSIEPSKRPKIWTYTHVPDKRILQLEKYGVKVYASIDNKSMYDKFKSLGFSLFAFSSDIKKGKSVVRSEKTFAGKSPICWEQLGSKESCEKCGYCIEGKGDIVFLKH